MSERNIQEILTHLDKLSDSYSKLSNKGMQQTAQRYSELKSKIEQAINTSNFNTLIDFAIDIFNRIKWEDDDKETFIVNRDYRLELIHILNIFIADKSNANLVDFKNTKEEFKRIVNIIEGFRR